MNDERPDFDTVYRSFYPRILRYLVRMVGPNDAEDVSQDVFSKISRSLDGFRGDAPLATWVYRIATNAALDRVRDAGYRASARSVPIDDPGCGEEGWTPETGDSAERQAIREEMSGCVRELLMELPESYRTVLVLSEMEGLKNAEIADVLGVTLDTVKIRLHRARARMRKSMESRCDLYLDQDSVLLCDRKAGHGPTPGR